MDLSSIAAELGTPFTIPFWLTVSVLALLDSINPCMISVMIMMVATLAALGVDRRSTVLRAVLFTFVVFLTYLGLGVLIYFGYSYLEALAIAYGGFSLLKWGLVAVLLFAGLLNVQDALGLGGPSLAIPKRFTGCIQDLLTYVSLLATVLLAFFVTLVELPCTGIFYLGLIAYLHSSLRSFALALPVLVYYNILFVLPEIGITLAVWAGMGAERLKALYARKRKLMRILEGIALLLLAILLAFLVKVG